MFQPQDFRHVSYLWDDAVADKLDPVERLVYRSNILGSDQRVTNTGGGNTSAKIAMTDPLSGETVDVLWVKGSGGDLRTSKRANFASLYMDKLIALQGIYGAADVKGVKSEVEDRMVEMYPHTVYGLNPRASSIDTPLHAFIPARHVDHTHPNAVIAIAASADGERLTQEIWGGEVGWTDWQRPGFDLGLKLQELVAANPHWKGIILGQHGLINWADDDKACYELSLELIEKAARYIEANDKGASTFGGERVAPLSQSERAAVLNDVLPKLRGMVSQQNKFIATVQDDAPTLRYVCSNDAARLSELGTSCPDHFLRTKIKPLYVDWNPQTEDTGALLAKLTVGLEAYRADYASYYAANRLADSPAMRDPNPTVILIPSVGMIAFGKNKSESRVTAEFYTCAIEVMRGAEAVSRYISLPHREAFDIEYWGLEEAKLRRMPPEKELERDVVVVVGAGNGIGKSVAHRVAREGAHVIAVDLVLQAATETADELTKIYGKGIGVAGSGISGCGPAIALGANIAQRDSVRQMFQQIVLAYGGIDHVIVTAGVFISPDTTGFLSDEKWLATYQVNVIGAYLVADEARAVWKAQGLKGSLVLTTSVNAVVPKKGTLAYDTSKAAANHLIRELAIELAPLVRVNGVAPATVVEGSTMFPRDRVMASLTKYDIPYDPTESDDELRAKLAGFYAQRTLTKQAITPADQAEAAYLLVSRALSKTTGQIISVDGGLHEAFLR